MDRAVVERKLESLRRYLERIASKRPASFAALESDLDLQDVLVLNLSRAVQSAPTWTRNCFPRHRRLSRTPWTKPLTDCGTYRSSTPSSPQG